jgi:Phosphopantetheine attachment site
MEDQLKRLAAQISGHAAIRTVKVWRAEAEVLVAEITPHPDRNDVSRAALLQGARFDAPVLLAIAGSVASLDQTALQQRALIDTPYETAASPAEAQMIAIWEKILDWAPVGRLDHFFNLGGDSLAAMEVFARLGEDQAEGDALDKIFSAPYLFEFAAMFPTLPRWLYAGRDFRLPSPFDDPAARLPAPDPAAKGLAAGTKGRARPEA